MTYDSARSRMVLFGGDGPNGLQGDTWTYDGSTWTQMKFASSPTPRDGPAMAFDPARGRAVLFGGHDSNGRLGDTWEWDGANWTQIPVTVAPHTRFWESLAFDTQRGKTILFGGDHVQPNDLGESNDTWEWDGAQWTLRLEPGPAARQCRRDRPSARDRRRASGGRGARRADRRKRGHAQALAPGL